MSLDWIGQQILPESIHSQMERKEKFDSSSLFSCLPDLFSQITETDTLYQKMTCGSFKTLSRGRNKTTFIDDTILYLEMLRNPHKNNY